MFGLTTLGTLHTAVGLVALLLGFAILLRHGLIRAASGPGKIYLWLTAITALTGLGIFQHGGFNKAHVLSLLTLVAIAVAVVAARGLRFGRRSAQVEVVACSLTVLFHLIPGITESGVRLPPGQPLFSSPDDPNLQVIGAALFIAFLAVAWLQCRKLGQRARATGADANPA